MCDVIIKHIQKEIKLMLTHRLDDKPLIMAKEEETSARACSLSSFEDHISVKYGIQGIIKLCKVNTTGIKYLFKLFDLIEPNGNTFFNVL